MSLPTPTRPSPRFVPTLTDVVEAPLANVVAQAAAQSASASASADHALLTAAHGVAALPEADEKPPLAVPSVAVDGVGFDPVGLHAITAQVCQQLDVRIQQAVTELMLAQQNQLVQQLRTELLASVEPLVQAAVQAALDKRADFSE